MFHMYKDFSLSYNILTKATSSQSFFFNSGDLIKQRETAQKYKKK